MRKDYSPEVQDIFVQFGHAYRRLYGNSMPYRHLRAMHAIEICRTASLGGHVEQCDTCNNIRITYNSCRNRHCPKCQFLRKEKWVEDRMQDLLPIPYFHVVFTIPYELNAITLRNQKVVYNILFRSAAETLKTLSRDPVYSYGRIGFICVLHTWGQNLMDHPHLHCIVTGGGLSDDYTTWIPCKKDFLFPVSVMSRLFRGKFLAYLVEHYKKSELKFPGAIITLQQRRIFNSLISKLYRKEWVVYSKPPFKNPETVFRYLSRYTHRIAISNQRIINVSEGKVHFRWRDYADGNTTKVMVLDAYEFIRRFLLHILPEKFVKIRYYGLFGNKNRRRSIEKCRSILHVHSPTCEVKQEQWQDIMLRITGFNVRSCPFCEHGTMRMSHSLPSVRCNGPPAVSK